MTSLTRRLSPSSVPIGLSQLDRKSASTLLAIFEDSKAMTLITAQIGNLGDKAATKLANWRTGNTVIPEERFLSTIAQTALKIENGTGSDEAIKFALWAHLRDAFDLEPVAAISPRDLDRVANDVGVEFGLAIAEKRTVAERARLSKIDFDYWKTLAGQANPLKTVEPVPFDEAVREVIAELLGATLNSEQASDAEKQELIAKLREELADLDGELIEKADVRSLTDDALVHMLTKGGGLLGLMGAVELAGFSAYILAAQASSIIPIVGGQTLVSSLFVLSHPLFVIPAVLAATTYSARNLGKSVSRAFATSIVGILAVRGIATSFNSRVDAALLLCQPSLKLDGIPSVDWHFSVPHAYRYRQEACLALANVELPDHTTEVRSRHDRLEKPIDGGDHGQMIEAFLFPSSTKKIETAALSAITIGDLLFDLSSIDPRVLEAANFAYESDLGDPFAFATYSERISSLSAASISGHENLLLGYTAERVVAARLSENGHLVSLPESSSQPGFDLLVDGHEFQVKCIEPDNFAILSKHFETYPEIPVIANSEVAPAIEDRLPESADKVYFVEGYSYDFTDGLVRTAMEAGLEVGDYEIIPAVATVSAIKNIHSWWRGHQNINDTTFNVTLDTAAKGLLGVAGGFAGTGIGLLLFGPAGAYVFGGVGAVAATTQSNWIVDRTDKLIDPKHHADLTEAAKDLLRNCIKNLEAKILGIESKMAACPQNKISEAMKNRWAWEKVFVEGQINRAQHKIDSPHVSGEINAIAALEFAAESGIHPISLQSDYKRLLALMNAPKDRWRKSKERLSETLSTARSKFDKNRRTENGDDGGPGRT